MLADFMKKDLTYAVLGAAMEEHHELCRLLVGIQEPGFEQGENLRKSCSSAVFQPVPRTTLDPLVVKSFGLSP